MKGSRVQAVVNELSGERIDIVPWSDDINTFVSRALSPARIASVRVDSEEHSVLVIVEEDQLSLAIGKDGQNVRLASRLTGWDIELTSSRDLEQRERLQEQLLMPIEEMVGVTEKMAERLREIGVNTVQKLIRTPRETILEAPGLGPKTVDKLLATAEGTVEELENALEDLIRKENEQREKEKLEEKPLFDESVLTDDEKEVAKDAPVLTEEELFRDPDEIEEDDSTAGASPEAGESEDSPEAGESEETPSEDEGDAEPVVDEEKKGE